MKKYAIAALLFVSIAAGSWIVAGTSRATAGDAVAHSVSYDTSAAPTPQEIMFVAMMTDHHEQAVTMGEIVAAASGVPERVSNLAAAFQVTQAGEIGDARRWLSAWETAGTKTDAHAGHGSPSSAEVPAGAMTMKGMIGPDGFAELEASAGVETARVYLRLMIEHHEGAIETTSDLYRSLSNPWVVSFAQHLIEEQSREVAAMRRMRESLG